MNTLTKNFKNFALFILLLTALISLQSCKDDTVTNEPAEDLDTTGLTRLNYFSYAVGASAKVIIYTEEPLHTGYNKVYVVLRDSASNTLIKDAHVIPSVVDHAIGGFAETPGEIAVNGKFAFGLMIVLPQVTDHWNIKIGVHNHGHAGEPYGVATFGSLHISDTPGKFQTKSLGDGSTLYLSYINPRLPVTGLNNYEFLINRSFDTSFYAVDTSYIVTIKPVLLSSGVASTGNTNPVVSGVYKHYLGKVNLTAPGTWRINMYMTKPGYSDSTYFETTF